MAKKATTIVLFLVVLLLLGSTVYISIILTTGDDLAFTSDTQASEPDALPGDPFAPTDDEDGPLVDEEGVPLDADGPDGADFFPDGVEGTEGAELLEGGDLDMPVVLDENGEPLPLDDILPDQPGEAGGEDELIDAVPFDGEELLDTGDGVPSDIIPDTQDAVPGGVDDFLVENDDEQRLPADGLDDGMGDAPPGDGMDTSEDELAYLNQQGEFDDLDSPPDEISPQDGQDQFDQDITSDLPETGLGQPTPTMTPSPTMTPTPSPTFMPTMAASNTPVREQPTQTQALPTAGFNAGIIAAVIAGITILSSFFL